MKAFQRTLCSSPSLSLYFSSEMLSPADPSLARSLARSLVVVGVYMKECLWAMRFEQVFKHGGRTSISEQTEAGNGDAKQRKPFRSFSVRSLVFRSSSSQGNTSANSQRFNTSLQPSERRAGEPTLEQSPAGSAQLFGAGRQPSRTPSSEIRFLPRLRLLQAF